MLNSNLLEVIDGLLNGSKLNYVEVENNLAESLFVAQYRESTAACTTTAKVFVLIWLD